MAIAEGWASSTLPRHLHRAVLRLLRSAESATRRLIIIVARGIAVTPRARRPQPAVLRKTTPPSQSRGAAIGAGKAVAPRSFTLPLFDPLPRLAPRRPTPIAVPRICVPGFTVPFPVAMRHPPMADDAVDTKRLNQRLSALVSALDNLPTHARRFARWKAARDAAAAQGRAERPSHPGVVRRISALRPGLPPGRHSANGRRRGHEVHDVLNEVHGLALWALEGPSSPPDTS